MSDNNRKKIIQLIENATSRVQIAVSWLTDELIIRKLQEAAGRVKVEILLSRDPLNAAFHYAEIRDLQAAGATVLKTGTEYPGQEQYQPFMHAKFMIIDDCEVHGGSFNFTKAANYNYEVFREYAHKELAGFKHDLHYWLEDAVDYNLGFENPDTIRRIVNERIQMDAEFRAYMLSHCTETYSKHARALSERDQLIQAELEKERKRAIANSMVNGAMGVGPDGVLSEAPNSVKSKKHRNFGGRFHTEFNGVKKRRSYGLALLQKKQIERRYDFLRCQVVDDTLVCTGTVQPESCDAYRIRIEFRAGCSPQVYILDRNIEPLADIHMYHNGSLCLYYPGDLRWKDTTNIADHIIPWVYEWIVFFEIYQLTGEWEADHVPHGTNIQSIYHEKQ